MMNIDQLTKEYQALKAPPELLARVNASLAEQDDSGVWWTGMLGAAVTVTAVAVVFLAVSRQPEPVSISSNIPSLSTLSKFKLQKPKSIPTSLTNIRNVSIPPMPVRPILIQTKPGKEDARNNKPQEKDDVYV
jgi:hypothetical protein